MARSSYVAAAWVLKSERGGVLAGPRWVQAPPRRRDGGRQTASTQAEEARGVKGQPASVIGPPGPREPAAYGGLCCTGHGSRSVERWGRRGVEQLAIGPWRPDAVLFVLAGSCRWWEASAFADYAGFSQLCKAGWAPAGLKNIHYAEVFLRWAQWRVSHCKWT